MMTKKERIAVIIISIFILVYFCGLMYWGINLKTKESPITRTITAKVIGIENDNTLLEDTTGNVWSIEDDSYSKGDEVIVTFNTKETNSVLDDEIIKIKKRFNNE